MTVPEITELYAYNRWANDRVLEVAGALGQEQYTRDLGSSFPSVAATLAHVIGAEWVWLSRWKGVSPTSLPADWNANTHADLVLRWRVVEAEQLRFVNALDEARLAAPVSYRNFRGDAFTVPLVHLMRHVVNHSTYHRGQVTTLLRQLGMPATATDLVLYHTSVQTAVAAR